MSASSVVTFGPHSRVPTSPLIAAKSCDTIPAPQNIRTGMTMQRTPSPTLLELPVSEAFQVIEEAELTGEVVSKPSSSVAGSERDASEQHDGDAVPARTLCVRHQRMADEGINLKLQDSLDALPVAERETVATLWSTFSSSSHPRRALILEGILTMCCFSELSLLSGQLGHLIRLDPFSALPREISLSVLKYLDAVSLTRAAQVSRSWRALADDDILWKNMCEQHIEKKCTKCGWGLPLLDGKCKRLPAPTPSSSSTSSESSSAGVKRPLESDGSDATPSKKAKTSRRATRPSFFSHTVTPPQEIASSSHSSPSFPPLQPVHPSDHSSILTVTRPWKSVYSERLSIERNWRRGRCGVTTLTGHTDGVMCLQFSESYVHPSFPVLITGSYDRTARVWNMETGQEVNCLRGHTRAIRALQFDEVKLITGSMDHTLKVWDWRSGKCIRTLEGHTEGVVSLHFDAHVLASGSVDTTIKVWNFRTGECFTLRGHRDWVNAVSIWQSPDAVFSTPHATTPEIDVGKMLLSASDDGTIRLWDLTLRTCVRQFTGHVGQVQCLSISAHPVGSSGDKDDQDTILSGDGASLDRPSLSRATSGRNTPAADTLPEETQSSAPVLISGSLDNTIKIWDLETAKCIKTCFGHIEGIWAVGCDKLRLVSGSNDRTIKIWCRESGRCMSTLVGHRGAVTSLAIADDKIVSGSDYGDIKIWNFAIPQ